MKSLIVLSLLVLSLSLTAAEKYAIKLTRPSKVGDKYERKEVENDRNRTVIKVSGKEQPSPPDKNQDVQTIFEGVVEVLDISEKGKETKSRITIRKLATKVKGDVEVEILKPETVVEADMSGEEASYTVGGKAVSEEQAEILGKFFKSHDRKTNDDEIFGSDKKQAVGEKWKIDAKLAAKELAEVGMIIGDGGLEGWVTLKGIVEKDGVQCLDIRGELTFTKLEIPLPEGVAMSKSLGKVIFEGLFPVDETKRRVQEKMQMNFDIEAGGLTQGIPIEIEMIMKSEKEAFLKQVE